MSKMSHINVIEKYEEHRLAIHQLLSSILNFFADGKMFEQSQEELTEQFNSLYSYYPFVSLFYLLDAQGKQITVCMQGKHVKSNHPQIGIGADRSRRPYYIAAMKHEGAVITEPYLASVRRELCLSTSVKMLNDDGSVKGYVVLNIDLKATLAFLTGDSLRVYFEPYFKTMYSLIVVGLFSVALVLLYTAALECISVAKSLVTPQQEIEIPFGVVIYLTLALAIFDLGKTTLEEEVLLYKDILRHSSTRRTITRFIAVIIIAVSIEALLMIFKAALHGGGEQLIAAVWIIIAAAALLVSLGVYVYLGSRAESILLQNSDSTKVRRNLN
ncbi:MAG: Cache domain protein [Methylococcales bacterium]|nr:Cache domain protein [Methylococcales bacterium]